MSSAPNLAARDLAQALVCEGRFAEACQHLAEALRHGETPDLWNDWGVAQLNLGNSLDAERAFLRALRLNTSQQTVLENLGVLLFFQKRYAEALPYLKQSLETCLPESRDSLNRIYSQCAQFAPYAALETAVVPPVSAPPPQVLLLPPMPPVAPSASYMEWFSSVFRSRTAPPSVPLAVSWDTYSPVGRQIHDAIFAIEVACSHQFLREIRDRQIPGDLVEFGIFQGHWINRFWEMAEGLGLRRRIYGFDSFQGLSDPHPEFDFGFWQTGQYTCSFEDVARNVKLASRPNIKLIPGFFSESLQSPEALLAGPFSFARIDCDIYEPALECLRYLSGRLSDGAILVFDDWPHERGFGEQRAFEEWLPTVPHLDFEFLFYAPVGHFYLRARHR